MFTELLQSASRAFDVLNNLHPTKRLNQYLIQAFSLRKSFKLGMSAGGSCHGAGGGRVSFPRHRLSEKGNERGESCSCRSRALNPG